MNEECFPFYGCSVTALCLWKVYQGLHRSRLYSCYTGDYLDVEQLLLAYFTDGSLYIIRNRSV